MKKIIATGLFCFILQFLQAQVTYYKGEWTEVNSGLLFGGIFKLDMTNKDEIKGELIWTYLVADSSDQTLIDQYKDKKGRRGIEYVSGTFNPLTNDLHFEGKEKKDPSAIIGLDKYTLKLSSDKRMIYGKTDSNGKNNGLFYGYKISTAEEIESFNAAKTGL